jgi:hypothetical protein
MSSHGPLLSTHADRVWKFTWKYFKDARIDLVLKKGVVSWDGVPHVYSYRIRCPDGSVRTVPPAQESFVPAGPGRYVVEALGPTHKVIVASAITLG